MKELVTESEVKAVLKESFNKDFTKHTEAINEVKANPSDDNISQLCFLSFVDGYFKALLPAMQQRGIVG
jgi:hypothetical protein